MSAAEVYLVNDAGEQYAGFYPANVAEVMLADAIGWHRADPTTGDALAVHVEVQPPAPTREEVLTELTLDKLHELAEANHVTAARNIKHADLVQVLLDALPSEGIDGIPDVTPADPADESHGV